MVENALARRSRFSKILAPILEPWSQSFLVSFFGSLCSLSLTNLNTQLGPFFETNVPKGIQDELKKLHRSSTERINSNIKKTEKHIGFYSFLGPETSQDRIT